MQETTGPRLKIEIEDTFEFHLIFSRAVHTNILDTLNLPCEYKCMEKKQLNH